MKLIEVFHMAQFYINKNSNYFQKCHAIHSWMLPYFNESSGKLVSNMIDNFEHIRHGPQPKTMSDHI